MALLDKVVTGLICPDPNKSCPQAIKDAHTLRLLGVLGAFTLEIALFILGAPPEISVIVEVVIFLGVLFAFSWYGFIYIGELILGYPLISTVLGYPADFIDAWIPTTFIILILYVAKHNTDLARADMHPWIDMTNMRKRLN